MKKHIEKQEKFINAVMVFIFDKQGNVLLLKRKDNNLWEPVKGGMHSGERWEVAGKREVEEETGLKVEQLKLSEIIEDELKTGKGHKIKVNGHVTYTVVSDVKAPVNLNNNPDNEHIAYKWISLKEISKENLYPPSANFLIKNIISKSK